jgi:hypothetical protein
MVVRKRVRAVLIPLALYCVAGGAVGYFLQNAKTGNRGLDAKQIVKLKIYDAKAELAVAQAEHRDWDRRIALLAATRWTRTFSRNGPARSWAVSTATIL